MNLREEFQTVSSSVETKYKEKGSLFIGQVYPVENSAAAEELLNNIRKKYYDASHHCYAMAFVDGNVKYSDAGEPSGTAGIRILNAIQHFKLENVLVVVIRYFGGVKLGVGPLGKAYYNSAFMTLESAPRVAKTSYKKFKMMFDFQYLGQVHHLLSLYSVKDIKNIYTDKTEIEFLLKLTQETVFLRKKEEILREADLVYLNEIIYI